MAALDLLGSYNIPPEVSELIFFLAGPEALTNVRCTNRVNADAYKDVAFNLVRQSKWVFNASQPLALQIAEDNRLPCIRITDLNFHSLPTVARFEWLRELYLDARTRYVDAAFMPFVLRAISRLPPRLVLFSCSYLDLEEMPVLPDSIERLDWEEYYDSDRRLAAPLPSSLKTLWITSNFNYAEDHDAAYFLDLPELPPSLGSLDIDCSPLRNGTLPQLPPALKHLVCVSAALTRLPPLPSSLVTLDCATNNLRALPSPLPAALEYLDCDSNDLEFLPTLVQGTLQALEFDSIYLRLCTFPNPRLLMLSQRWPVRYSKMAAWSTSCLQN